MKLSPDLVKKQAAEAHDRPIKDTRAAELAEEVGRLNARVAGVADGALGPFDEPAHFPLALERLRDRWPE